MIETKVSSFKDNFIKKIKSISTKNEFECAQLTDGFGITLSKGDMMYNINLDEESLNEELNVVEYIIDNAVGNREFCNILFKCPEGFTIPTEEKIRIEGYFTANLNQTNSSMVVLANEVENVFNFDSLDTSPEYQYSTVLNKDVLICDVFVMPENQTITSKRKFEEIVNKISEHVIAYMLYNYNINLIPYNKDNAIEHTPINYSNSIMVRETKSSEALKYFIVAENIELMNFKYLDYYHVLEYFFLDQIRNSIDAHIDEIVLSKLKGANNIDEKKYQTYNKIIQLFSNRNENDERRQLKAVINRISSMKFMQILSDLNINLENFKTTILATQDGRINLDKLIQNKTTIKLTISDEDADRVKSEFIERIYLLRNYLVHTKKGEKSEVFLPTKANLKSIENDVKLIREIAFHILFIY